MMKMRMKIKLLIPVSFCVVFLYPSLSFGQFAGGMSFPEFREAVERLTFPAPNQLFPDIQSELALDYVTIREQEKIYILEKGDYYEITAFTASPNVARQIQSMLEERPDKSHELLPEDAASQIHVTNTKLKIPKERLVSMQRLSKLRLPLNLGRKFVVDGDEYKFALRTMSHRAVLEWHGHTTLRPLSLWVDEVRAELHAKLAIRNP